MRFMAGKSRREYSTGESIFSQGDLANSVFYILSGKVKLTVVSMNGKEAVIAHLPATSFFGEASLAGETHRIASASALEASTIVRIDKTVMQDLLHREPQFAEQFLAHMLSRNNRMQADLVDHLVQFQRKAPRPALDADGELRPGVKAHSGYRQDQSGDPGRNDWHHQIPRQLLPQSVSRSRLHRLQLCRDAHQ